MPKSSAQVFFLLDENVLISEEEGKIGHLEEMKDIPAVGEIFLIANSYREMVLGPFQVTSEQYNSATPVLFHRRIGYGKDTILKKCHWLFDFGPVPDLSKPDEGLPWAVASKCANIPYEWWRNIRKSPLSHEQFLILCQALIDANEDGRAVAYPVSSMSNDAWEDYLKSYYGDMAEWGSEGEPLNDAADRDLRFGGDDEAYESNGPGHGNE